MLLNGNVEINNIKSSKDDLVNLEKFLEENKTNSENDPWSKLDKTIKTKKLVIFSQKYKDKNNLNDEECELLIEYLKDCLDRKKLHKAKIVNYDKITGEIKDIPLLTFNKPNKHFTLKNCEKRVSTLKSLSVKKNNTKNSKSINIELSDF
jgi:hypothetical protein